MLSLQSTLITQSSEHLLLQENFWAASHIVLKTLPLHFITQTQFFGFAPEFWQQSITATQTSPSAKHLLLEGISSASVICSCSNSWSIGKRKYKKSFVCFSFFYSIPEGASFLQSMMLTQVLSPHLHTQMQYCTPDFSVESPNNFLETFWN